MQSLLIDRIASPNVLKLNKFSVTNERFASICPSIHCTTDVDAFQELKLKEFRRIVHNKRVLGHKEKAVLAFFTIDFFLFSCDFLNNFLPCLIFVFPIWKGHWAKCSQWVSFGPLQANSFVRPNSHPCKQEENVSFFMVTYRANGRTLACLSSPKSPLLTCYQSQVDFATGCFVLPMHSDC